MSWDTPETAPAANGDAWGAAATNGHNENGHAEGGGNGEGGDVWGASNGDGEAAAPAEPAPELSPEEYSEKAKAAGWTEKTNYDYAEFQCQGGGDDHWHGTLGKYEWKDEYGDVGPEVPQLEKVLFGGEFQMSKGNKVEALEFHVTIEASEKIAPIEKFEDAGLHPVVLENIGLARYDVPTAIQRYTIPAVLQGLDVVGIAQTGSGKTAAYMIPVISKLMGKAKKLAAPKPDTTAPGYDPARHTVKAEPLVVIVVPTRELAMQIFDEARRMCYRSMLRPCVVYGGLPMGITRADLGAGCDVLIATPGRLCDLMDKPHILSLSRCKYTIIDEADEMLDSDWEEELNKIMTGGDTNEDADHVYMMFSATFPKGVRRLAGEYMAEDFVRLRVGRAGSSHKNIKQNVIWVDGNIKKQAVFDLLYASEPARTMIFCNSKGAVDELDDFLYNRGLPTTSIHADRNQREREDAMRAFRTGKAPILIATGISARGWDVKDCKHVINYDLPSTQYGGITEYIHRIGRTGRIGNEGLATSFFNDRNDDLAEDLTKVLIECGCDVPDFLQSHIPEEGQELDFDDNSADEAEADNGGEGGFESAEGVDAGEGATAAGWGAAPAADDGGFASTEGGFSAAADSEW